MSDYSSTEHYIALQNMYLAAPINQFYPPKVTITEGACEISIETGEQHQHSAGGVHGSVYFKLLDDAAFFAANSFEQEVFVLTTSYTTYLTRPIAKGVMRALAKVVNKNRSQFIAESIVYDEQNREIGRGNRIFVRGKFLLKDAKGYGI